MAYAQSYPPGSPIEKFAKRLHAMKITLIQRVKCHKYFLFAGRDTRDLIGQLRPTALANVRVRYDTEGHVDPTAVVLWADTGQMCGVP